VTDYETIRVEHESALSWIVLDRPAQANALSPQLLEEFADALTRLRSEGGPVIAIRGAGKGFCAGIDLSGYGPADQGPADPLTDRARLQANVDRWLLMWDHPKPVIAAVHGYCMATAAQMCIFADITIVTEDAKIGEPKIPIGGGFIAPTWVSLVGTKRAKEFAFVPGNWIDGRTAVEWGWANHCVPTGSLIPAVRSLAERIAMTPPEVLHIKKLSVNRAAEAAGFRQSLAGIADADVILHLSPSVLALRKRIKERGLKAVIEEFKVAPTTPLLPVEK
jgi:enoyl-CoA hydratase